MDVFVSADNKYIVNKQFASHLASNSKYRLEDSDRAEARLTKMNDEFNAASAIKSITRK